MKKLLLVLILILAGCATSAPMGMVYTEVKLPVNVTSNGQAYARTGVAECKSILGLVAFGDCSIESAKKQGGVSRVYHVDWEARNILGILGEYRLVVYGE
ncbi:MAG: TRL-like family protein [Bdellovibrionota bacterium]|nr:TRL-like family protein [Pseudomonadota bacterium]MDY6090519.1 TRL-like family protein [Bdellovibrionota bacterium]